MNIMAISDALSVAAVYLLMTVPLKWAADSFPVAQIKPKMVHLRPSKLSALEWLSNHWSEAMVLELDFSYCSFKDSAAEDVDDLMGRAAGFRALQVRQIILEHKRRVLSL